jgi:hypothetical protein
MYILLVSAKILIITLVFEKNANFLRRKLAKIVNIVFITSTPGLRPPILAPVFKSRRIFGLRDESALFPGTGN